MVARKKRREPPIQVQGVLLFFLVVIALCIYAFYVLAPPLKKQPPTVVVPKKPRRPPAVTIKDYTSSCRQINERVVLFVKKQGGREKDFRILQQRPRQIQSAKWVQTEADVYLPWKVDIAQAAEVLAAGLKAFPGVAVKWDRKEADRIVFTVWLNKLLSHSFTVLKRPPRLAIIIDDIGADVKQTQAFLDLGIPLTLSVLPGLTHSQDSETIAHQRGYEVMLHLPMEPSNPSVHNPGQGAIFTGMDEKQIAAIITTHLQGFRYIKGVNNHMGSRATEDEKTMTAVLKTLRARGLYFVDSLTTPRSKAYAIAQKMNIPSGKRVIFMDNEPEVNYSKNFIHKAIRQAKQEGEAIVIGHPRETTLAALKEMTPRLKAEGISLVFVSELLL